MDTYQCKQFLLSLNLLNGDMCDKDKIRKLYTISNRNQDNYRIYSFHKPNGKLRVIYEPNATLKYIQRQILKNILNDKKISSYAKAYHPGISLVENAKSHLQQPMILKLDIQDFFNHIRFLDVYKTCFSLAYFPKPLGMLLTYLCTYEGHLPQGAPTSAYIANLVMQEFDEEIGSFCEQNHIQYTRYSDDMTFSGCLQPHDIIVKVGHALQKRGLKLNKEKIHVIHRNGCQKVTGIVVNQKLQVPKVYRNKIRQEIYYIKKFGVSSHLERISSSVSVETYLHHLRGKIEYVLQINPFDTEFVSYRKYMQEQIDK